MDLYINIHLIHTYIFMSIRTKTHTTLPTTVRIRGKEPNELLFEWHDDLCDAVRPKKSWKQKSLHAYVHIYIHTHVCINICSKRTNPSRLYATKKKRQKYCASRRVHLLSKCTRTLQTRWLGDIVDSYIQFVTHTHSTWLVGSLLTSLWLKKIPVSVTRWLWNLVRDSDVLFVTHKRRRVVSLAR